MDKHLTKKDLESIKIGTELRIVGNGDYMSTKVVYVGIFDSGLGTKLHTFVEVGHAPKKSYTVKVDSEYDIVLLDHKRVFWNYEDACDYSRKCFCDLITHYNHHQFKNNPIKFE